MHSLYIYALHMARSVLRFILAATACSGVLSSTGLKGMLFWMYKDSFMRSSVKMLVSSVYSEVFRYTYVAFISQFGFQR